MLNLLYRLLKCGKSFNHSQNINSIHHKIKCLRSFIQINFSLNIKVIAITITTVIVIILNQHLRQLILRPNICQVLLVIVIVVVIIIYNFRIHQNYIIPKLYMIINIKCIIIFQHKNLLRINYSIY